MGRLEGKCKFFTFSLQCLTGISGGAEHSNPIHALLPQFPSLNFETRSFQTLRRRWTKFFTGQIRKRYKKWRILTFSSHISWWRWHRIPWICRSDIWWPWDGQINVKLNGVSHGWFVWIESIIVDCGLSVNRSFLHTLGTSSSSKYHWSRVSIVPLVVSSLQLQVA